MLVDISKPGVGVVGEDHANGRSQFVVKFLEKCHWCAAFKNLSTPKSIDDHINIEFGWCTNEIW